MNIYMVASFTVQSSYRGHASIIHLNSCFPGISLCLFMQYSWKISCTHISDKSPTHLLLCR